MAKSTTSKGTDNIAISFTPPSVSFVDNLTKPWYAYFTPEFFGIENLDAKKPALYVANHTIYGVTDGTLYVAEAYKKKGIYMRGLADNMHFMIPGWNKLFTQLGFARGSRENCALLMKQQQHILVYPGGSREVCKRKGEEYKLIWKDRTGFARMAIEHGYDIIPIVNVGGDDAYEIVKNPEEVLESTFIGKLLKKSGLADGFLKNSENVPPLALGIGNTIFPKPVKLYFGYGERISTKAFKKEANNKEIQWQIREQVELSMNKMMLQLLEYRANDDTKYKGKHREWFLNKYK
jgi:1-acyl-sn-glycerol-3-phosphate acyltransferase